MSLGSKVAAVLGWVTGTICAVPGEARGADSAAEVRVDCPELDSEQRAAIEARHMSDLVSQGVSSGTLLLICSEDRVSGTWEEHGVVLESRFMSRNAGESAIELLHWLASVLLEMRQEHGGGGATEGQDGESSASALPVEPLAPEAEASATLPPGPVVHSGAEPLAPTAAPAEPSLAETWTLGLSASYAHFGTELAGELGPAVTLRWSLGRRWGAFAAADVKVGLGSNQGFGVVDMSAALGAFFDVVPFLTILLSPELVLSTFTAPPGTTGAQSLVPAFGLAGFVRARWPLRAVRPFVDVGAQLVTPVRQVTLEGAPVLTLPEWRALLAAGIELSL